VSGGGEIGGLRRKYGRSAVVMVVVVMVEVEEVVGGE
jgi:hypothetical protein